VLVTSGTLTSAELLAQRLPEGVIHQFAPVDAPGAVAAFLHHWRPSLGVFVESELWPNLIGAAKARNIPLALVSARITRKSAEGWARFPGAAREVIPALATELGATSVHWSKRFGATRQIDVDLKATLPNAQSYHGSLLHEPWSLVSGSGTPFKVFTPFWKAYLANHVPRSPFPAPDSIPGITAPGESLDSWNLEPSIPWDAGLRESWTPGEAGAQERLADFLRRGLAIYHRRDEPAVPSTSRLSPHLRFGEISPYQIWHSVEAATDPDGITSISPSANFSIPFALGCVILNQKTPGEVCRMVKT
jgi:hypothetical protein